MFPDLQVGSRTQTPEAIQAGLGTMGFESVETTTQSEAPVPTEEKEPPAAEETDPAAETKDPSEDAGSETAAGDEETPDAGTEPAGTVEEETETPAETAEPPATPKKKTGAARAKAKVNRVTEENEELKRRIAELEKRTAPQAEPEINVPEASAKPTLDQFSDQDDPYLAYSEALVDWKLAEKQRTALETEQTARKTKANDAAKAQAEADQKAAAERWQEQVDLGRSRYTDFDDVMKQAESMSAAVPLTDAVRASDLTGLLGYYLASHPEELERLNRMLDLPPTATKFEYDRKMKLAHLEVAKLEALVSNEAGTSEATEETGETQDAGNGPEIPATDASREARTKPAPAAVVPVKTTPKAATPPPAAKPPVVVKPKPEPIKPVGSRNGSQRKTLQQMSKAEIHAMQQSDPDGFRDLVLRSRG